MNKTQSLISLIISLIVVIALPIINKTGIVIDESSLTDILQIVITIVIVLWTCWKNHNFTQFAQMAQGYLNDLKDGNSDDEFAYDDEDEEE